MCIPPLRSCAARLALAAALVAIGAAPALAVTPLHWMESAGSAPADEFHVYAGQTTSSGLLVYSGYPTPDASGVFSADVQIDAIDQGLPVYVWVAAANAAGESAPSNVNFYAGCDRQLDADCDGVPDDGAPGFAPCATGETLGCDDNCPFTPNPGQEDSGGLGVGSPPDGIGDACQCGDVNGDGRITKADSRIIMRALMVPPKATMDFPELCDVGGAVGCSSADAAIIQRALLVPPTATIRQVCAPASPPTQ